MASKNLGAVIQRAISDGAFRRQLQSDPAAALRGFNLTSDEIAAIRSGDSSKLMSLGVDQRMSKAYSVGANFVGGAARDTVSDLGSGNTANVLATDSTSSAREGIIGDPTSSSREALSDPTAAGTRAIHNTEPTDLRGAVSTGGDVSGARVIHNTEPTDLRGAVTTGNFSGTRAIHDSAPFDSRAAISDPTVSGTRAIHDSAPADLRGAATSGDFSGSTRAVNDSEPFAGNAAINDNIAAANAGRGGSLAGDMSGSSARAIHDVAPVGDGTLASHMADAGDATSIRSVHDVAPFEGNVNAAASSGGEFLGGDARLDPGTDSAHGFVPSDSADVQREMLDGGDHGNALGNTGGGHPS